MISDSPTHTDAMRYNELSSQSDTVYVGIEVQPRWSFATPFSLISFKKLRDIKNISP